MNHSREADSTSLSLLKRACRQDVLAWRRLTDLYSPIVYSWCRRSGLQYNDAADAVQDVFRQVFQGIGAFRGADGNGGSFRGWLWTISRNQIRLHFRKQVRSPEAIGGTNAQVRFATQADHTAGPDEDEPESDLTRVRLLHRALEMIKDDFNPVTWEIFSRVALREHSIQDVARDHGVTENAVRQMKFRVLNRLREELDGSL